MRALRFLIAVPLLLVLGSYASARPAYYKVFKQEYLDTNKDKKFVEAVEKADVRCLICHQGKKHKDNRNPFGKELAKLLNKKDQKNTEKISASIKKVLAMRVNPKDEKSETYMDRLKAGKWPGGDLEDLKKEPKDTPKDSDAKKE
jgi:hypothetical protein